MPLTQGYIVGTSASTIQITPPNFSFMVNSFYVGNTSTVANDNKMLTLSGLNYGVGGVVTGTVNIGYFPQTQGSGIYTDDEPLAIFPAGAYITATASSGSLTFTYNGSYVYYRE